jgi:hypothetical protein
VGGDHLTHISIARFALPAGVCLHFRDVIRKAHVSRSRRVCRIGEAVFGVHHAAERIIEPLGHAPWRMNVEAFAGHQFHAWCHKMQFMVPCMLVTYPQDAVAVRLQSREGHPFKAIHDGLLHRPRDDFSRCKAQHA